MRMNAETVALSLGLLLDVVVAIPPERPSHAKPNHQGLNVLTVRAT